MEKPKVSIVNNGVKHEISMKTMMNSLFLAKQYVKGKDIICEGPHSHEYFSEFLKLLENPKYIDKIMNLNVVSLLKDWDCIGIIDDLVHHVESKYDHLLMHNGHRHRVNMRTFSKLSEYFCSQVESSPGSVVSSWDEYSEETFSLFLGCVHGIEPLPLDEKLVDIYILCQNWKCNSLLNQINIHSKAFILTALSKGDFIEQHVIEENATLQIHDLIQEP